MDVFTGYVYTGRPDTFKVVAAFDYLGGVAADTAEVQITEPPVTPVREIQKWLLIGAGTSLCNGEVWLSFSADLITAHSEIFVQGDFLPGQNILTAGAGVPLIYGENLAITPFIGGRVTDQQDCYFAGGLRLHAKLGDSFYASATGGVELWSKKNPSSSNFSMNGTSDGIAWEDRYTPESEIREARLFGFVGFSYGFDLIKEGGAK